MTLTRPGTRSVICSFEIAERAKMVGDVRLVLARAPVLPTAVAGRVHRVLIDRRMCRPVVAPHRARAWWGIEIPRNRNVQCIENRRWDGFDRMRVVPAVRRERPAREEVQPLGVVRARVPELLERAEQLRHPELAPEALE